MTTSVRGSFAVAALCAILTACGGSDSPPAPTVLPASVAIANDARADAGAASTFKTDLANTEGLSFRWDFGDGSSGTGATASHTYAKPGTYQVTLAVANTADDLRTATSTIVVGAYANVTGLVCSQADSAGWCWQHAIVSGHLINSVYFQDATHAWAVGDNLTILKSADGGNTWSQVALDATLPTASLQAIRFYDAMHGTALDDRGGALHTADGGATWTAVSLGGTVYGAATSFVDYRAGRLIVQSAYTYGGAISVDEGNTWTAVGGYGPLQATSTDCWSFASGSIEVAAGCGSNVSVSLPSLVNNGSTYFASGAFESDTQAIVVGAGFSYTNYTQASFGWTTTDGGLTWTPFTPNGLPQYYYASMQLRMISAQVGLLYSPNDIAAYTTTDGGLDWTLVASSTSLTQTYNNYRASGLVGNNVLWQAAGNRLSLSTDLGKSWHDVVVHAEDAAGISAQTTNGAVIQYTDANDFVVSFSHRFYVTSDGGQSFRQILGADSRDAGAMFATGEFSDIHHGRFLTSNGALLSTSDGGRTWTRQDYHASNIWQVALHFTSATEGWLVLDGKLAHSTDGGATWSTPLTSSSMVNLQSMSWGDATHGWTWNGNALFYTVDGGATWTQATLPNNQSVGGAIMTGPLTGVAVSGYGGAAVTKDGGATWQAVTAPVSFGTLVSGGGQTVWSFTGYSIQRSKDGGQTWQAAGPTLGSTVSGIAFADATHGWLVTGGGTLLHTTDGGDSWAAQPVGPDLVLEGVAAADAQTAWVITRDGQILSTATAGN